MCEESLTFKVKCGIYAPLASSDGINDCFNGTSFPKHNGDGKQIVPPQNHAIG